MNLEVENKKDRRLEEEILQKFKQLPVRRQLCLMNYMKAITG